MLTFKIILLGLTLLISESFCFDATAGKCECGRHATGMGLGSVSQRNKETEWNNQPLSSLILFQNESQTPG